MPPSYKDDPQSRLILQKIFKQLTRAFRAENRQMMDRYGDWVARRSLWMIHTLETGLAFGGTEHYNSSIEWTVSSAEYKEWLANFNPRTSLFSDRIISDLMEVSTMDGESLSATWRVCRLKTMSPEEREEALRLADNLDQDDDSETTPGDGASQGARGRADSGNQHEDVSVAVDEAAAAAVEPTSMEGSVGILMAMPTRATEGTSVRGVSADQTEVEKSTQLSVESMKQDVENPEMQASGVQHTDGDESNGSESRSAHHGEGEAGS